MEEVFNGILDRDESIIKVLKPNKAKMFWSLFIKVFFMWFWVALLIGFAFGESFGTTVTLDDGTDSVNMSWSAFLISVLVVFVIFIAIQFIVYHLTYTKTYYAYTNKRVLIRHGIIGVDYKSLDKKSIGAVTVNVSLLDKMVRKNTGTIMFGSMSSPFGTNANIFRFENITDPYDIYKEIKNDIDDTKNKENAVSQTSEKIKETVAAETPVQQPVEVAETPEDKEKK